MTPDLTAAATRAAVHELGGAFAEDPKTLRRARQLGLTGWSFSVGGRGGALGDVRPDTVAAALGFIAPDAVRDGWETARRVTPRTDDGAVVVLWCGPAGRVRRSRSASGGDAAP